jgi:predicted GNAT superfamily acetyltransferase
MPTEQDNARKVLRIAGLSSEADSAPTVADTHLEESWRVKATLPQSIEELANQIADEARKWKEVKRASREEATRHFLS